MSLKEEILSRMPNDLNDLEKARYLYIELGKRVSFSTKFNNTDFLSSAKMRTTKVDINTFNENQVNCIMWSSLYSQLLDCVGISNNIIKQGHDYVEFYIDGVRWCADATYGNYTDLARIHNNDETSYFGPAIFQKNSKYNSVNQNEENVALIKELDKKIGYNEQLTELKDFFNKIKNGVFNIKDYIPSNEIIGNEFIYCIEYLFSKISTLKSGYYESKDFVKELLFLMLNDEQLKKVKAVELKRTNKAREVDIIQCIYVYDNDLIHYYLLAPNLPIKKVTQEEIIKLATLGYSLDEDKTIPGIDFPKNFIPGKVSTNLKYKLFKNYLPKELLIYDIEQFKTKTSYRH